MAPTDPSPPTPPAAPLPARIGKYRILRRLGEGATSEVFLAHDDFLDRPVALKRLRAPLAPGGGEGAGPRRSFAAEAALVGRLQHPNLCALHDAVDDPAGPYLVMEWVEGGTLKDHCRPDRLLPLDEIVDVGFKCALALGHVARQGLIHRDVKPANILIGRHEGRLDVVKVSDFGSVLQLNAEATQTLPLGSLAYMAPEQVEGRRLDARADLYALGAVLYHLIAGRPPFEADSTAALIAALLTAEPAPLTAQRPGVSPALDALVRRCLAKDPAARPAGWDALAQELADLVSRRQIPRRGAQEVQDTERFALLRQLEFFKDFGDIELWEVVRRADWQRHPAGSLLHRAGETGDRFHILARGRLEVWREGRRVADLGAGTSVGEMAYLAPNPELRVHQADIQATEEATTLALDPARMASLSPGGRQAFDQAFIRVLVRRLHAAHEALAHPRRVM